MITFVLVAASLCGADNSFFATAFLVDQWGLANWAKFARWHIPRYKVAGWVVCATIENCATLGCAFYNVTTTLGTLCHHFGDGFCVFAMWIVGASKILAKTTFAFQHWRATNITKDVCLLWWSFFLQTANVGATWIATASKILAVSTSFDEHWLATFVAKNVANFVLNVDFFAVHCNRYLFVQRLVKTVHNLVPRFVVIFDGVQSVLHFRSKGNVPHFFVYAKDKTDSQVEDLNESFVNKLDKKIVNPRINCRNLKDSNGKKLGDIDYTKLVSNPDIKCKVAYNKNGTIDESKTDPLIVKYCELNQEYHFKINMKCVDLSNDVIINTDAKQRVFFKNIANEIRYELSQFGYTDAEVTDILVKFLYHVKPSKHKDVLWFSYGGYIVDNLKRNNCKPDTKVIQCVDCGEWIEVLNDKKHLKTCRCDNCDTEYKNMLNRNRVNKCRNKNES